MSRPIYLPQTPVYLPATYSVPPVQESQGTWPGAPARVVSAPTSTNGIRAQAPAAPRPIFRAKGLDEPVPPAALSTTAMTVRLSIPTPEQLGVSLTPIQDRAGLDWASAHRRLERLGAVCFHLDKLESGACRFTCILPTPWPGMTHRVESEATTAAEAVNVALSQAEKWAASTK